MGNSDGLVKLKIELTEISDDHFAS